MTDQKPEIVFYDGDCALCHGAVKFILPRDRHARFAFAPIGGEAYSRLLASSLVDLPDSIIVLRSDGSILARSAAALHILRHLGHGWRILASVARAIPRPLRDWLYDRVAKVRRRLFSKPAGACPLVSPELRRRLLV